MADSGSHLPESHCEKTVLLDAVVWNSVGSWAITCFLLRYTDVGAQPIIRCTTRDTKIYRYMEIINSGECKGDLYSVFY